MLVSVWTSFETIKIVIAKVEKKLLREGFLAPSTPDTIFKWYNHLFMR